MAAERANLFVGNPIILKVMRTRQELHLTVLRDAILPSVCGEISAIRLAQLPSSFFTFERYIESPEHRLWTRQLGHRSVVAR